MTLQQRQVSNYLYRNSTEMASQLGTLGHPDRFAVLSLLLSSKMQFSEILTRLGISKTSLSNHIQILGSEGFVNKVQRGEYEISYEAKRLMQMLANYLQEIRKYQIQSLQMAHLQKFTSVEVNKMNLNRLLNKPLYQPSWISYTGAIAGVLQAMGENYDVVDVSAYSGYAFLCNVSRKSTHIAAVTAHSFFQDMDKGIESMGYEFQGFWEPPSIFGNQGLNSEEVSRLNSLFEHVKEQIDLSNPVILWGLAAAEFGIVTGYEDDYYDVSTFRGLNSENDEPIHYTKLDSPGGLWAYHFGAPISDPDENAHREIFVRAQKILIGNAGSSLVGTPKEKWEVEEMDYISGVQAYEIWARNLEQGNIDQHGNSYLLACYQEARWNASEFAKRMYSLYKNQEFGELLMQISALYKEVALILEGLHRGIPFPHGNNDQTVISKEASRLREVMKLEQEILDQISRLLNIWT